MVEKYIENGCATLVQGWSLTKPSNNSVEMNYHCTGPIESAPDVMTVGWHHVAAVRSNSTTSIYLDGVQVGSGTSGPDNVSTVSSLKIGHRGNPSDTPGSTDTRGFYLNGLIDEVEVFNRAITTNEIQAIYNAGSAGKCLTPPYITSVNRSETNVNLMWWRSKARRIACNTRPTSILLLRGMT